MYYTKKDAEKAVKAVIYIRYSSHRQADSYSIEYQTQECEKYITQKGYKFVKQYIDEAKTGKKTAGRDAFDAMIHDAAQNKFDRIIVFSFSRSFRNTRDALNYNHELMTKYNVIIESVIERIDMTNPHGKFSGTNLFAMHELQADIIAAHVRSGMYIAAQHGYYLGGYVPYGYQLYATGEQSRGKDKKKYEIHADESVIVRQMYALYADGFSLDYIQNMIREKGIKGRKGDIMGIQTIARILKNPFYIGTRKYNIKGYDPLFIENAVPAIIDMQTWQAVQARHAGNAPTAPRRTKRLYSLTGKIFCAKCGAHLFGTFKGDKRSNNWHYAYYHCATKKSKKTCDMKNIRKDQIEKYCLQEIKKYILNPASISEIAAHIVKLAGAAPTDLQAEYKKLTARKNKLNGIVKRLKKDNLEGEITDEIYREMTHEYLTELAELDLKIYQLEAAQETAITHETVTDYLNAMLSDIDSADENILKAIFDKLIDKIIVHDDAIELYLIVSPYPYIRDNKAYGQPHYALSLNIARADFIRF